MSLIKKIAHIGVVVPKLDVARAFYEQVYGVTTTPPQEIRKGVKSSYVPLENSKLELMEPFDKSLPMHEWLMFHPKGGIHHIAFSVENAQNSIDQLDYIGLPSLTKNPLTNLKNEKHLFLDPEYTHNVLTELVEE